jgi:retron-type reverse transcriptase
VGILELQAETSRKEVADLVGLKPSALSYLLYYVPDNQRYKKFEIAKKDGGTRKITAPLGALKVVETRLSKVLYACCDDIDAKNKRRCVSHGFRNGRSIFTNAHEHRHRRFVLNLDIEDFFPSFNFGRVRGFFIKSEDFQLKPDVATAIAQIACFENGLPQGSPCSPVISDLIAGALDGKLVKLAKSVRCTYTRYADDLTFSTNQKTFPTALAHQDSLAPSAWHLGTKLLQKITSSRFIVNDGKTRMQCRGSRQLVTGLIVNEKVNIRAAYYRSARAMCQNLFATGKYFLPAPKLAGAEGLNDSVISELSDSNVLEGILSHIHYIRNRADLRDRVDKKRQPTATRELYKRFLFFKYFVNLKKPLIVCEGKTDGIYIRAAMKSLLSYKEQFFAADGNALVSVFNQKSIASEILQLEGGTEPLKIFLQDYHKNLKCYSCAPLAHPVIVLVDNDNGASSIFSFLKQKLKVEIGVKSPNDFYHVHDNLYVVKTPEIGENGTSCIESLFAVEALATKVDGISFQDGLSKFGFAEKVVLKQADKIDFSKFSALLDRIIAVIEHYQSAKP